MPPKKTYTFQHFQYPDIYIIIDAYSKETANNTLKLIAKSPKEFILK